MNLYCVKCKTKTLTKDIEKSVSKNGRPMLKGICDVCGSKKSSFVKMSEGGKLDIHKWIGKIPQPSSGWTPPGYNYMGPYNPLEKQLE